MFSFESFVRLNRVLSGVFRLIWLNVLWSVTVLCGAFVIGFGPATFALSKYIDGWVRRGDTPAVASTFVRYVKEGGWPAVRMGAALLGLALVAVINLFSIQDWTLRFLNVAALVLIVVIGSFAFFVMAALDVETIRAQIASSFLIAVGSLHWTIIAGAVVAGIYYLLGRFAFPLFVLLGISIGAMGTGLVFRRALRDLSLERENRRLNCRVDSYSNRKSPTRATRGMKA